jgi:EpsI family protein
MNNSLLLNAPSRTHYLIGLVMIVTALMSVAMRPTYKIADQKAPIDLETMIPKQFKDWKIDESVVPLMPNPQQTEVINKIYAQTLSRTYVNNQGERVMLSIAYGSSQRDSLRVHNPEVCYAAQGFQVPKPIKGYVHTQMMDIPVKRMVAVKEARIEPITYWIVIGDKIVPDDWRWKLEQLKLGFHGIIPDGLLFRVSMISDDDKLAYEIQNDFISALLGEIKPDDQHRLFGRFNTDSGTRTEPLQE